jgi:hypothetical protein
MNLTIFERNIIRDTNLQALNIFRCERHGAYSRLKTIPFKGCPHCGKFGEIIDPLILKLVQGK